jgi:hypothetical protein
VFSTKRCRVGKDGPGYLAGWTICLLVDFHLLHGGNVGILDDGVDRFGVSRCGVKTCTKELMETYAREPVTRKVRGRSFLKLSRKVGHSSSGRISCAYAKIVNQQRLFFNDNDHAAGSQGVASDLPYSTPRNRR